jgi:hypothetical protein
MSPPPWRGTAFTAPPWACATDRTIDKPSPAPLGILVTGVYAATQGWPTVVPAWAMAGGVLATVVIGAIAGLYPAVRAARLAPTQAPDSLTGAQSNARAAPPM